MGKRILISLLLIVVVIAAVAAVSSLIFRGSYEDVTALEAQATAIAEDNTFGIAEPEPESDSTEESDQTAEEAAEPTALMLSVSAAKARMLTDDMTLEEKICQMLFVTQEALTGYNTVTKSGEATQSSINEYPVGGIIYFSDNLITVDQVSSMISNIQEFSRSRTGIGLFIGIDEEGGSVARLANAFGTASFDDMAVYGAAGNSDAAYEIGTTLAGTLLSLGFNVDFAPVADVLTNEDNEVVQTRSFGSDPDLVSRMVEKEVAGFVDSGVLCAPKHFPGHGSTGSDTHDGFAASDRTMSELEDCDLKPFQAAIEAGAPMIMVGHMTMTEIDGDHPASLSNTIVTGILRNQMGYDGIIITDSLSMSAITDQYTCGEAAVMAIEAGCDMLLCVPDVAEAVEAITEAVENGTISEARIDESVTRILTAKLDYGIIS